MGDGVLSLVHGRALGPGEVLEQALVLPALALEAVSPQLDRNRAGRVSLEDAGLVQAELLVSTLHITDTNELLAFRAKAAGREVMSEMRVRVTDSDLGANEVSVDETKRVVVCTTGAPPTCVAPTCRSFVRHGHNNANCVQRMECAFEQFRHRGGGF